MEGLASPHVPEKAPGCFSTPPAPASGSPFVSTGVQPPHLVSSLPVAFEHRKVALSPGQPGLRDSWRHSAPAASQEQRPRTARKIARTPQPSWPPQHQPALPPDRSCYCISRTNSLLKHPTWDRDSDGDLEPWGHVELAHHWEPLSGNSQPLMLRE